MNVKYFFIFRIELRKLFLIKPAIAADQEIAGDDKTKPFGGRYG